MRFSKIILTAIFALSVSFLFAQVEQVNLDQTKGKFTTESLTLAAGAYQFNIGNKGVGHDVGFVIVPKGKYDATDHIKAAYVTAPVPTDKSNMTNVVNLEAGEYEYFCPLNKTPKYSLTVRNDIETIKLEQTKGKFETTALTVAPGNYQFNIGNNGVGTDVGFVLVPKGKYDAANHIKEAYVTAPVPTGKSNFTNVVKLEAGEYEYFCPLNPTPKYSLTVRDDIQTIKLGQVPGVFKVQALTVTEGMYQFEIGNNDAGTEVGFVLVPKGKYDAPNHIKEAYVKAPVSEGSTGKTGVVDLKAGTYEYFCPLNKTPKYTLTVIK